MNEELRSCLLHINKAIADVGVHTAGITTFGDFQQSLTVQRAVERELEIMGEAMSRILKLDPTITISNAKRIVYTRNRIIHGYDSVDITIIYSIIINELPTLGQEIASLLSVH